MMAHHDEPMDVDGMDCDFDKENTFRHRNMLPCTEKGYEELDVSELNMKLRYSVTPASSPMSKSYTANCIENRTADLSNESLNTTITDNNLTRSLNSTIKSELVSKEPRSLPLQMLPTEQFADTSRNKSVLRQLDTSVVDNNVTVTISSPNDDDNLSSPSSSSSALQTPATTPTKDIQKSDGGSPIMRGLKSVLSMFRSSQSPIPPNEEGNISAKELSPVEAHESLKGEDNKITVIASTPIAAHRSKELGSKRSSPYKDSIVFNDDLEKELQWKDETTILFSHEKIPIHKLLFQQAIPSCDEKLVIDRVNDGNLNTSVEYMDISCNNSMFDRTMTDVGSNVKIEGNTAVESDSEFLDCETTFTKHVPGEDILHAENATQNISSNTNTEVEAINIPETNASQDAIIDVSSIPVNNTTLLDNSKVSDMIPIVSDIHSVIVPKKATTDTEINDNNIIILKDNDLTICLNDELIITPHITLEVPLNKGLDETKPIDNFDTSLSTAESIAVASDRVYLELEIDPSMCNNDNEALINTTHATNSEVCIDANIPAISNLNIVSIVNDNVPKTELPSDIPLPDDDPDHEIDLTIDKITPNNIDDEVINDASQIVTATINEMMEVNSEYKSEVNYTQNELVGTNPDMSVDSMKLLNDIDSEINLTTNNSQNLTVNLDMPENIQDVTQTITASITHETIVEKSPADITREVKLGYYNKQDESLGNNPDMSVDSIQLLNDIENIVVTNSREQSGTESHSEFIDDNLDEVRALKEILKQRVSQTSDNTQLFTSVDVEKKSMVQSIVGIKQNEIPIEFPLEKPSNDIADIVNEGFVDDKKQGNIMGLNDFSTPTKATVVKSQPSLDNTPIIVSQPTLAIPITKSVTDIDQVPEKSASHIEHSETKDDMNEVNVKLLNQCAIPVEGVIENTTADVENTSEDHNLIQQIGPETNVMKTEAALDMTIDTIDEKLTNYEIPVVDENSLRKFECCDVQDEPITLGSNFEEMKIGASEAIVIETPYQIELEKDAKEDSHVVNNEAIEVRPENFMVQNKSSLDEPKPTDLTEKCHNLKEDTFNMVLDPATTYQEELSKEVIDYGQIIGSIVDNDIKKEGILDDEEIIVSENTSPFVSMAAEIKSLEEENKAKLENTSASETEIIASVPPPSSPPIQSKGYNFDFDEMDDPFATKTKIRLSPPPNTPDKLTGDKIVKNNSPKRDLSKNKRKSLPEIKKPGINKTKLNSTIAGPKKSAAKSPCEKVSNELEIDTEKVEDTCEPQERMDGEDIELDKLEISEMDEFIANEVKCNENQSIAAEKPVCLDVEDNIDVSMTEQMNNILSNELKIIPEIKNTSSSEQSTYYSAGTSSCESIPSRNVFNLPEIDDMNFNPFASKSKMRLSPPPSSTNRISEMNCETHEGRTAVNIAVSDNEEVEKIFDDKMETEPMEKESSGNLSSTTCSSKNTDDYNTTVREVNTEDEDTIEGPFLEAEDLQNIDKISDIDCENGELKQVNDFPTQANENMPGEMFIDAEAFEFLLNQNKSNMIADSGKESLFLKFDPLFAKRMSTEAFAALGKIQNRQSTPTKARPPQGDITFDKSPIAGPSNLTTTYDSESSITDANNEDLYVTVSKPMMVVTPAVNPAVTPRNKSLTPTRPNRHSITFTSPAMAVIDRLLSMSANNSLMGQDTTFTHPTREQHEADIALTQLRELLAEKEINVYNLKSESKELKDRLTNLEAQMHTLATESQDRLKKIDELTNRLSEKTRINRSMGAVVEEYERTIASLIAEIEQDKKRHAEERMQLIKERDEQTAHLSSMEVSFSDLHSKYEKSKQIILSCKAAEDTYKKTIKDSMENFNKMQNNYELLKQHATSKLNHANSELEKLNRSHEAEVLKLNAMIKRKDLHITSLEETLTQKTKANDELTAICDELINKVG